MENEDMMTHIGFLMQELRERLVRQVTKDKEITSYSSNIQDKLNYLEDLKNDLKKKEI